MNDCPACARLTKFFGKPHICLGCQIQPGLGIVFLAVRDNDVRPHLERCLTLTADGYPAEEK